MSNMITPSQSKAGRFLDTWFTYTNLALFLVLKAKQTNAALKDKRKEPISKKEKSEDPNFITPQFINVTNSAALDESARTKVRVQVMRDYHRRRVQKINLNESSIQAPELKPPSGKGQTHKFRFGKDKGLRPWVPVKGPHGKRRYAPRGRGKTLEAEKSIEISNAGSSINRDQFLLDSPSPAQKSTFMLFAGIELATPPADKWLPSLDFAIQTSSLYHSPGIGYLDPFAATSLLITPRTQVLIHHYCKQCYRFILFKRHETNHLLSIDCSVNDRLESSWLMLPMRKMLFSLAINDAAMFHSFLCHYAGTYNVSFRTGNQDEALYHASQAAKIVNERLVDPAQALTNETIATVANMAAFEVSVSNVTSQLSPTKSQSLRMVRFRACWFM
jgi:hypothetical protein